MAMDGLWEALVTCSARIPYEKKGLLRRNTLGDFYGNDAVERAEARHESDTPPSTDQPPSRPCCALSFDVHMCTSLDSGSQTEKLPRVSHTILSPPLMTWVVGADVAVCIESHTPHPHPEAPASVVSSFDHFQKVFSSGPHFHPEKLQSAPASSSSGAQQGVNMDGREAAEDIHLLPERFWKTPALAFSPEEMDAVMVSPRPSSLIDRTQS